MTERNAGDISLSLKTSKGFVGKVVQAVLGFIGTIIFARILGPTSFGGYYYLLTLLDITDRPLRGLGKAAKKRYSEEDAEKAEIIGAILITVTAFTAITALFIPILGGYIQTETNVQGAAFVFLSLLFALGLFSSLNQMLSAGGLPSIQIWNDTLRSVLTLGLQLLFVMAGFGAAGLGYGLMAASLLAVPLVLHFIDTPPAVPSLTTLRSVWEFARYSIPSSYVSIAYSRLDILLLGFFLTTGAVGQYEVARKLTIPATLLSSALGVAFMPKISNLASREENIKTDITNALSFNSIFAIPIFFGSVAISTKIVVTMYGSDYRQAAIFLTGLAAYQVISTQKQIFGQVLLGLDRPDINLRVGMVTFIFNIIVGIMLLFSYGAVGVVVATVLSEFIMYSANLYFVRDMVDDLSPVPKPLLKQILAGLVMFFIVEILAEIIPVYSWVDLLVIVGSGAVVYGLVLLVISHSLRLTLHSVYADATS